MIQPLNHILGATSKVKLLRVIVPLTSPVSGREAMRLGGIRSKAGGERSLEELSDLGVLEHSVAGGTHLYSVNRRHHLYEPLAALFDREAASMTVVREELRGAIERAGRAAAVISVIVFGSVARGDARAKSDLDVLVLTRQDNGAAVESCLHDAEAALRGRLGLTLSAYVMERDEAVARWRAADPLLLAVVEEGRTLIGEEVGEVFGSW